VERNRLEYEKRVNRVIDHIRAHLADDLTLADLARVAAFSPFHFHRIFRGVAGETLFGFIQRVRIERAAVALLVHPDQSVLEVALDHGFSSAATFARAFRARFGATATQWRAGAGERWARRQSAGRAPATAARKPGTSNRKRGNAGARGHADTRRRRSPKEAPMTIEVKAFPGQHVAYMRYVGPYGAHGIPALWERFRKWMQTRDLRIAETVRLGVAYDDPRVTDPERCRYDACVVVPADFVADRWVNVTDLPGGRCAVAAFAGGADEIEQAWERVFAAWLPESGYQPDDRPCFEVYRGNPFGADGRFRCELCLPVRPL